MKAKGKILLISPGRKEIINVNNHQKTREENKGRAIEWGSISLTTQTYRSPSRN
jgi:hypothetical protein